MADQLRWFKVWTSILNDPDFTVMPVADIGRWVLLGAAIAACGTQGSLRVPNLSYLTKLFRTVNDDGEPCDSEAIKVLANFPHILLADSPVRWLHGRGKRPVCKGVIWQGLKSSVGGVSNPQLVGFQMFEEWCRKSRNFYVLFANWSKYQIHTTALERGEKIPLRRDETRQEETRQEKSLLPLPLLHQKGLQEEPGSTLPKWGTPEALIALYNLEGADELPAVEVISAGRLKKAREYLKAFPQQQFWLKVFQETKLSLFLRGLKPSKDHPNFKGDFDWLLNKGKDGTENCSKVWEEKYRDA